MELSLGNIELNLIGAVAAISLTISLTTNFVFYRYTLNIINNKTKVVVGNNSGNVNIILNQGQFNGLNIS